MKIVLAYSGGLDTSIAIHWLRNAYKATIVAFCADLGQLEDLEEVSRRANIIGADEVIVEDLRSMFLSEYVVPALRAGARYEGKYLLAAPLGRPLIARRLVDLARVYSADAVAHGATGKGNDQVRFASSIRAYQPSIRVLSPAVDWQFKSRSEARAYAIENDIAVGEAERSPYSIDTNIWGTSFECGPLDDLSRPPGDDARLLTRSLSETPNEPQTVTIGFQSGVPSTLNGEPRSLISLVQELNTVGGLHGIGRTDIVENRLVGFKTRGVYESPAGELLHAAHHELENLVLPRESLRLKTQLSQRYAELVYDGLWCSDLRRAIDAFVDVTQERVSGEISLQLYHGRIDILSRSSRFSLYDQGIATYDSVGEFDIKAGVGFAYIWSLPLRMFGEKNVVEQTKVSSS